MLLKDGKEFNLEAPENKKELEAFLKAIPPFGKGKALVVKYDPSLITWSDLNGRWESPESRHCENRQVINRPEKGNETWIYCKTFEAHQATGAILTRTPWDFQLNGTRTITWEDLDLAFFLWLSKNCGNGETQNKNAVYVFEDKEFDARIRLDNERSEARVKSLILNDETEDGLSDDKITEMVAAYQLPNGMGKYQSRTILFSQIQREKNGFEKFMKLLEDPFEKRRKVTLNKARHLGVLILKGIKIEEGTGNNQGWRILDRNGDTLEVFAKHRKVNNAQGGRVAEKLLMEALEREPKLWKQIEEAVAARDVVVEETE